MNPSRPQYQPVPAAEPLLLTRVELTDFTGIVMPLLRAYTQAGLLPFYREPQGQFWRYDFVPTLNRLAAIDELQRHGLELEEIQRRLRR